MTLTTGLRGNPVRQRAVHRRGRLDGREMTEVRLVLHRDEAGRASVIEHHLARIRRQRAHLDASETFPAHVIACEHDLLTRCPACSAYASTPSMAPSRGT